MLKNKAETIRRLFITDDEADFRLIVRRVAERAGWETIDCADGAQLMNQLTPETVSGTVFLDLNMPEMDGIEVLRRLAVCKPGVSVILSTGAHPSVAAAAQLTSEELGLNVVGVLSKPMSVSQIGEMLTRAEAARAA